jgi:hypothetical protein
VRVRWDSWGETADQIEEVAKTDVPFALLSLEGILNRAIPKRGDSLILALDFNARLVTALRERELFP